MRRATDRRSTGQAAVDYLLVVALVAVALSVGDNGPVAQLARALGEHYQRFSWAMAQP
jgi:hypothetical protein